MGDRKARLAALAAKAGRSTKPAAADEKEETAAASAAAALIPTTTQEEINKKKRPISFRNYAPTDNALDIENDKDNDNMETDEKDDGTKSPTKRPRLDETVQKTGSMLQQALQDAQADIYHKRNNVQLQSNTNADVTAMAPKKINWDLKRDIQDKMAKLERRTQKAIVELLKQRLEHEAAEQATSDSSDLD